MGELAAARARCSDATGPDHVGRAKPDPCGIPAAGHLAGPDAAVTELIARGAPAAGLPAGAGIHVARRGRAGCGLAGRALAPRCQGPMTCSGGFRSHVVAASWKPNVSHLTARSRGREKSARICARHLSAAPIASADPAVPATREQDRHRVRASMCRRSLPRWLAWLGDPYTRPQHPGDRAAHGARAETTASDGNMQHGMMKTVLDRISQ
jgi:hypothetical protein